MADFNKLKSAQSLRRMAKGGPNRSSDVNDSFEEILHDLAELYYFVNNTIIPVFNGLGAAGTYNDFSVVTEGLDGKTLLTDNDWTDTSNSFFYNASQGRPKTVKETSVKLSQDVDALYARINTINARLGAIDSSESTNPATLAEIENSLNYFIGIVRTINTTTTGFLTASGIAAGIADNSINPSSFNIVQGDITLNAGLRPTDISGIDVTSAFDYTTGQPATYDIQDSIWRVKEFVEDISGDSIVTFAGSGLSGDSLKTHREKVGTGTVTTTNTHGLDVGDLSDTNSITARLTQIADFDIKISGLHGVIPSGVVSLPWDNSTSGLITSGWTGAQPSDLTYAGGYSYVPAGYTVTRVAGTLEAGGTTGLTLGIYRNRSSVNAFIYSGLAIPASNPGSATATASFTNTDLVAGDLVFVSGFSGDGFNARVFVWGTPS